MTVLDSFYGMHTGWWWLIGMVVMVLFWGTVLWGVFSLVRYLGGGGKTGAPSGRRDAEEILRQRYARGEINREEFRERRDELRGTGGGESSP